METEEIVQSILALKEAVSFLIDKEEIRGKEVESLNEKIDSVNNLLVDNVLNPMVEAHRTNELEEFTNKYGEKLSVYNEPMSAIKNEKYDAVKETFDSLYDMDPSSRELIDEENYVNEVEAGFKATIDEVKKAFGIPEEQNVSVTETPEGVDVKTDTDGDGVPETPVEPTETETVEEKTEEVEVPADGSDVPNETEVAGENEIDPQLKKELEEYLKS